MGNNNIQEYVSSSEKNIDQDKLSKLYWETPMLNVFFPQSRDRFIFNNKDLLTLYFPSVSGCVLGLFLSHMFNNIENTHKDILFTGILIVVLMLLLTLIMRTLYSYWFLRRQKVNGFCLFSEQGNFSQELYRRKNQVFCEKCIESDIASESDILFLTDFAKSLNSKEYWKHSKFRI